MSVAKKKPTTFSGLYGVPSPVASSEKKAVNDLREKINGLLEDPSMARKAALILEHWLRQKSK